MGDLGGFVIIDLPHTFWTPRLLVDILINDQSCYVIREVHELALYLSLPEQEAQISAPIAIVFPVFPLVGERFRAFCKWRIS